MIKLGSKVKDKVTGFQGIATARIEFLNGCIQIDVVPRAKKGAEKAPEGTYIDESQLEEIKDKKVNVKKKNVGGGFRNYPK